MRSQSTLDSQGRTIWIADAHRDDGKRFVVRVGEKLSIATALPKERQPRHGPIALRLPPNGGAGLAGTSGRKTASACDTNAIEMSADTTAHFIFVARNTFIKVSNIVVQ